jgi:hypothetical protein
LFHFLLVGVEPQRGQTLNAVLFERLTTNWDLAGFPLGRQVVTLTLMTEGALLFVAAQTGFVGGPQVLATMAMDRSVLASVTRAQSGHPAGPRIGSRRRDRRLIETAA